jgi:hypothetical protein
MYFIPYDSVLHVMAALHYDLGRYYEDQWKGRPAYVIGADQKGQPKNQLWIDKEKLILVRLLKFENGRKEEALFDDHIPLDQGWSETACTFYMDNRLVQKEYYSDCRANAPLDPALFDPGAFGKIVWFKDK